MQFKKTASLDPSQVTDNRNNPVAKRAALRGLGAGSIGTMVRREAAMPWMRPRPRALPRNPRSTNKQVVLGQAFGRKSAR